MAFDSAIGAANWHGVAQLLDGVDAGTMSLEELRVVFVQVYAKFVLCVFAHLTSCFLTEKVAGRCWPRQPRCTTTFGKACTRTRSSSRAPAAPAMGPAAAAAACQLSSSSSSGGSMVSAAGGPRAGAASGPCSLSKLASAARSRAWSRSTTTRSRSSSSQAPRSVITQRTPPDPRAPVSVRSTSGASRTRARFICSSVAGRPPTKRAARPL